MAVPLALAAAFVVGVSKRKLGAVGQPASPFSYLGDDVLWTGMDPSFDVSEVDQFSADVNRRQFQGELTKGCKGGYRDWVCVQNNYFRNVEADYMFPRNNLALQWGVWDSPTQETQEININM